MIVVIMTFDQIVKHFGSQAAAARAISGMIGARMRRLLQYATWAATKQAVMSSPTSTEGQRRTRFQRASSRATALGPGMPVFSRAAKEIHLSPQARAALGVEAERATPQEVIQAILKAPVDLLYFGGIGTYVKASGESQTDAGDRTNDPLRIDATEVRAKVVGEGANLGFTQRGRIEAALAGRRLNTDALDNSAGVDTSDHEVNIKILLGDVVVAFETTKREVEHDRLAASLSDHLGNCCRQFDKERQRQFAGSIRVTV